MRNIYFIFAKTEFDPKSYLALDSLVSFLKDHRKLTVEIGGHVDSRGTKIRSKYLETIEPKLSELISSQMALKRKELQPRDMAILNFSMAA